MHLLDKSKYSPICDDLGTFIPNVDSESVFPAPEGSANLYYGLIRSGKTYGATADAIELLKQGRLVYTTWPILIDNLDDRKNFFFILRNIIFFWKKRFYKINCKNNLHYINAETGEVDEILTFKPDTIPNGKTWRDYQHLPTYIEYLNTLNHCDLFIDEAWRVIDSYQKTNFGLEGRNLILVTGHKYRTVNLIAQRPTSVHVTARGNMNRFYKFVKISTWPWVRFARYEFQVMSGETVDETQKPISIKKYWASKKIFRAYNSYYYGELEPIHKKDFETFELDISEKILAILRIFPLKKVIHRLSTLLFAKKALK